MIASDNFRYTALCVNCSLCYATHMKRWVVTTHKKDFYHYAVTRNRPKSKDEKALLGTSLIRSHEQKRSTCSTLFCGSKMLNRTFITNSRSGELGFRNRKSTRDNPLMTDFAIRFPCAWHRTKLFRHVVNLHEMPKTELHSIEMLVF